MDKIYALCAVYVFITWLVFLLDNLQVILLYIFKKAQKESAFAGAFLQRKNPIMAVINIAAYLGFVKWAIDLIGR